MNKNFIQEIAKGTKNALIKKKIINYYINNGNSTIPDLSKELNLSIPTITKLITEMCGEEFLTDYGKLETSGGRYPNLYGLNPDSGYFIGVDIKKFTIDLALMNFKGEMLDLQKNVPFSSENTTESFENLIVIIQSFINSLTINLEKILNINISISGRVNTDSGYSYSLFYLEERSLTDILAERLGYSVSIDNDTRAMTYGEYMVGNVKNESNIIFINISWGLAVGIIIDGKLYQGKSGFAGEFGHINVFDNEILCHCGKKGCLETEASGLAIHRTLLERISAGANSILLKKEKSHAPIFLEDIIDAVNKEDVLCIDIFEEVGQKLGRQIAGLINIFNPELVIIGGTVSLSGDYILQPIKSAVRKYSLNLVNKDSNIIISKLKDKAGIVGSCLLARRRIFEES
ncbi:MULTISPECIES: ROK family transcriptional regulator [unclassified Dysgonomonas]|uniref:ROK family transcriptional regulator n=1 Tax=unclassified Dysgonomonas TaxID=2630389 RepID=UPI00067FDAEA|nr:MULTISPECIES: ROK family transcriptional regulator [unclassified Dysgonomonas]MBD8346952.1 ROK family transcriptional regulator [Dysgonomonas sp. HGC4]MBF0575112.1 ROK family transcriptional regulator [Dysgonomonas sp. GY617]